MGLRDFFKSLWNRKESGTRSTPDTHSTPSGEPERRSELRDAWSALEIEDFDSAIKHAQAFMSAAENSLASEARKVFSLAQFRKGNYSTAVPIFQEIASPTDDVTDWFNVVTSATLAGDIELGENAFDQALRCQRAAGYSEQPSVPVMRQYFACALRDRGEYSKALEQIDMLRSIYEQLKITDDTFLYIRGIPFLSHTMTNWWTN